MPGLDRAFFKRFRRIFHEVAVPQAAFRRRRTAPSSASHLVVGILALGCLLFAVAASAMRASALFQGSEPQSQKPAADQDNHPFTLKSERNLVIVRAVVRDSKGELVGNLNQKDFRVFDDGKPQQISGFSVQRANSDLPGAPAPSDAGENVAPQAISISASPKPHFLALYFDDNHLTVESAMPLREAAEKFLASSWRPGDYAGVFTATGQTSLDFTSDLTRVQRALARIMARPQATEASQCPDITPYQSFLISAVHDRIAELVAYIEAASCTCPAEIATDANCLKFAHQVAKASADGVWGHTRTESELTIGQMGRLIAYMAKLPGPRTLAFLSPGLIISPQDGILGKVIDRAIRDQVTVNSLDARGLFDFTPGRHLTQLIAAVNSAPASVYTTDDPLGGPTSINEPGSGNPVSQKVSILHTEAVAATDPLSEIAEATGGTFFHNDNDLLSGFKAVTSEPVVEYLLAYSPDKVKLNGAYHTLKVEIVGEHKFQVQARKGYLAPTKASNEPDAESAAEEPPVHIGDKFQAFPIALATENSAAQQGKATLTVSIHVDIQHMQFQKGLSGYSDVLMFRTALMTLRGTYVTGNERNLNLDLSEEQYTSFSRSGINAKTLLAAPSGDYILREVVEEKGTGKVSEQSKLIKVD